DKPEETFAFRRRSTASGEVRPPRGVGGAPVRDAEVELVGQSLSKGADQGAVVMCTVRAGGEEETYHMFLEAPGGNFRQAREYTLDDNEQVVPANSWWSAW